jgi:ornithine cyclodeaminase/alanine dehydrogenase-like protein (mu-crystallin family)
MSVQTWDAAAVRERITASGAADALAARLRDDPPMPDRPTRTRVGVRAGLMLVMPDESRSYVGVKLVTLAPDNPAAGLPSVQGVYVLLDGETLAPLVVMDAAELSLVRTAGLSLLGVRALRTSEHPRATVIGAGPQAWAHLHALTALDPVAMRLVVRDPSRIAAAERRAVEEGLPVEVLTAAPIAQSDLVVCATSSRVPLFDSSALPDQAVVVALGAHEPDARELDARLLGRAFVVVESREAARREAGDVVLAEIESARELIAADLGEVVRGEVAVDTSVPRVLKTVGEAWEDLTVASALWDAR